MSHSDIERLLRWTEHFQSTKGRAPRYYLQTFGCQQNDHDSEIASGILEEAGFFEVADLDKADLVLFNTCSVRAKAENRLYGHVGRLKPLKKEGVPLIGVFGCMMEQAIHRDRIQTTFPYVDFLLGAGAMELLPAAINQVLADESQRLITRDFTGQARNAFAPGQPVKRERPHRALVTIMTGCNNFCSYCIVPYTRGREISRPYGEILREAKLALEGGAVEILLLGQNVNSYGSDIRRAGGESPSFAELLRDVSLIGSLGIVRYMTSHPKDLSDELIRVIGEYDRIEPHCHLPLQSGSDRTLQKMNRRYTAAHYLDLIRKLRESRPGITITTDLIVGYPGESEEDFLATLRLMEEVRFDAAFTFLYSPRAGTPAAGLFEPGQEAVNQERFEALVDLQNKISLESNQALKGLTVDVLIDGPSRRDPDILSGRTRDDRLVNISVDDKTSLQVNDSCRKSLLAGKFWPVMITGAGSFSLEGSIVLD